MGFLDTLRGVSGLAGNRDVDRRRLLGTSGSIDDGGSAHPEYPDGVIPAADPEAMAAPPKSSIYDRDQWRKKLKRIVAGLPSTEPQWDDLAQEAGALDFGEDWIARCYREEFGLMMRQVVSDRVITSAEHRKLETARELMGIPDPEAESLLKAIIAEAEEFFGGTVEGA